MRFVERAVFLCLCYNIASGFLLNGGGSHLNDLLKQMIESENLVPLSGALESDTKWLTQPLDHFDHNEMGTWKMKYFQRMDMWKPKGPIYLYISGESPAHDAFLQAGLVYNLAKETNGAMVLSEHRYYGESKPFSNFTTENLKFLSSKQALADNARLLTLIKTDPKLASSKVVVIGGSYAGNLAAWMRSLYPDLVDAAIASSAPVLAKADYFEYFQVVSDDFKKYGKAGCFDKIRNISKRTEDLLKTEDGIKQLKEELNICKKTDMHKPANQYLLFEAIASLYARVAQYGTVGDFANVCECVTINKTLCSSKYDNLIRTDVDNCYDLEFDVQIESLKLDDNMMSWIYQTCTEFGYFQTSQLDNLSFINNLPVEYYFNVCTALYGPDFNEKRVTNGVVKTNEMYGGLQPNVTNVVFVNGDLDPWHSLSILSDLSNQVPAKMLKHASHCRDLFPDLNEDPKEWTEARIYIKNLVKKWIGV